MVTSQSLVVEKMELTREPLGLEAIYFISPTKENVKILASDGDKDLYSSFHVFFSSVVTEELLSHIKKNANLLRKLKTLKEVRDVS